MNNNVTVHLPQPLYQRLQRIAKTTHRSVEDVLTTTVNVALPITPDIPGDLADELSAMTLFNDESLQAAARSGLSPAQRERLDQLASAGGRRALTLAEQSEQTELLRLYDHAVMRRAKALAILALRGYDIDQISSFAENE